MKTCFISLLVFAASLFAAASAQAATDGAELAQKSGCMACHGIDKKVLGPAFKDVARRYKDAKDVDAMLAKKIKDGTGGVWGPISMPPNGPRISNADIKVLAAWVLTIK
jgi:cytochrome c